MWILFSQTNNPAQNLATEEYLLNSQKYLPPILFLWQNQNTIVVGRNQNTIAEINLAAVEKDQVQVVRRMTGGGTVFHDLGNLCFSLILNQQQNLSANDAFQVCLQPVLELLKTWGINAKFKGRNDLEVDGMKISGNAQLQTKNRILVHGTLLFDVDLTKIQKYLNVNPLKLASKKITSVQMRVTNIKELLKQNWTIDQFKNQLAEIYSQDQETKTLILDADDQKAIQELTAKKYESWEWNYGKNETFTFNRQQYFPNVGMIETHLNTVEGKITKAKFYGDFLGSQATEELETALIGLNYEQSQVLKCLEQHNLKAIFGPNVQTISLIELLFQ